jgi:hypothetical protein
MGESSLWEGRVQKKWTP